MMMIRQLLLPNKMEHFECVGKFFKISSIRLWNSCGVSSLRLCLLFVTHCTHILYRAKPQLLGKDYRRAVTPNARLSKSIATVIRCGFERGVGVGCNGIRGRCGSVCTHTEREHLTHYAVHSVSHLPFVQVSPLRVNENFISVLPLIPFRLIRMKGE